MRTEFLLTGGWNDREGDDGIVPPALLQNTTIRTTLLSSPILYHSHGQVVKSLNDRKEGLFYTLPPSSERFGFGFKGSFSNRRRNGRGTGIVSPFLS